MRTRMSFTVYGTNAVEIERRAIQVVCEYLNIEDVELAKSKVDMEFDVNGDDVSSPEPSHSLTKFASKVFVKIK